MAGPALVPDRSAVQQRNARYQETWKRQADQRRCAMPSVIGVGDRVLVKIPGKLNKLSGTFFPEPYIVVARNGSQVTVRRPADGRLFKRESSFVKKYVSREPENCLTGSRAERLRGTPRDFVEPLSIACREEVVAAAPQNQQTVQLSAEGVDQCTGYRTRSGRLAAKPKPYGDVVSH